MGGHHLVDGSSVISILSWASIRVAHCTRRNLVRCSHRGCA